MARHKIIPAAYLVLIKDGKILLLRRFNTGYEDGNYSLVAGHLDGNESFKQAMIREAKEEADLEISDQDLETVHIIHRKGENADNERVDVFIQAKHWQGEPRNMEPHKCDDLGWFPLDNLPANIIPHVKSALEHISNKTFYSEFGFDK